MIRHLWPLVIGFSFWALAFVGIYSLQYLGCNLGWESTAHRASLIVAYVSATGALVLMLLFQIARARRRQPTALDQFGPAATTAALAATVVTFAPTLVASTCI